MGDSDLFAIYVHHGGRFVYLEEQDVYVGGECEATYNLDKDRFGYFDATELVEKLGYSSWSKLWFKVPNSQSYRVLKSDAEVMVMLSYLKPGTSVIHMYVEGGTTGVDDGGVVDEGGGNEKEAEGVANEKEAEGGANEKEAESVGNEQDYFADFEVEIEDLGYDASIQTEGLHIDGRGKQKIQVVKEKRKQKKNLQAVNEKGKQKLQDVIVNEGEYDDEGGNEGGGEAEFSDEYSEDSNYNPREGESSDDDLDDEELASDDEEYINARQKVRTGESVFDLIDEDGLDGLGYKKPQYPKNLESDYESSDGDVCSDSTDEENEGRRSKKFRSVYDPRTDPKELEIKLGMRFEDGFQLRKVLRDNAISEGMYIKFGKVSKQQCEAKCRPPCEWRVYGSVVKSDDRFMVKSYNPEHTCTRMNSNKLVSSRWIATKYLNTFRVTPNMKIPTLAEDIRQRFLCIVPKDRLYRARALAQEMIRGSVERHYGLLRSYVAELIRVDRDGTFKLLLGEGAVFKGFYIGHSALRHGFKKSCRSVIGLDGCFLKTYLGGMLLVAVAKDGNNQMFPISWAVVEVENEECWTWFLKLLLEDLAISDGNGWTFISDQQKGLINAVSKLAPGAEHRNCARHVYMNWKKKHQGSSLKHIFWRTVRSYNVAEYKENLEDMKAENQAAYDDFVQRDVTKFCKAFISLHPRSDMISNNIAETFNGYILHARNMHIILMCEHIRRSLMVRQVENLKKMATVSDRICPKIRKKIEEMKKSSVRAYVYPNVKNKYEVCLHGKQFVVNMIDRTCGCRKWQVTGIPCKHACAAIHFQNLDPAAYVHDYYTVDRYLEAYRFGLEPVADEKMWPEAEGDTVKPPIIRQMPGRPKKVRRKDPQEDPKNPNKLKRFGLVMTCQNCYQKGHNSKTCRNEKVAAPPKGKRGRPRIHPPNPTSTAPKKNVAPTSTAQKTLGMSKQRRVRRSIHSNSTLTKQPGATEGPSTQESRHPGNEP